MNDDKENNDDEYFDVDNDDDDDAISSTDYVEYYPNKTGRKRKNELTNKPPLENIHGKPTSKIQPYMNDNERLFYYRDFGFLTKHYIAGTNRRLMYYKKISSSATEEFHEVPYNRINGTSSSFTYDPNFIVVGIFIIMVGIGIIMLDVSLDITLYGALILCVGIIVAAISRVRAIKLKISGGNIDIQLPRWKSSSIIQELVRYIDRMRG